MKRLIIKPIKMNEEVMADLERRKMIIRLLPSRECHRISVAKDTGKGEIIYKNDVKYGGHAFVACAIDNKDFYSFATHPGYEEIYLLGGKNEKTLYLLLSYLRREEFMDKLEKDELVEEDFICLECVFNDPNLSFFAMCPNVPHGECSRGEGLPATFYVTESEALPLDKIPINVKIKGVSENE